MRFTMIALGLAGLSACTETVPTGDFVPFQQVMAETEGRPYECTDHDPVTNSCSSIATNQQVGDQWISEGAAIISNTPRIGFRGRVAFTETDGVACADMATLEVDFDGDVDPMAEGFMRAALMEEFRGAGRILCSRYYRNGDGYLVTTTTPAGAPVAGGDTERVSFHAERPTLRLVDGM